MYLYLLLISSVQRSVTKVHLCISTMMMTQNFLCPARCNGHYRGDERGIIRLIRGTARGECVDDDDDFVFG